MLSSSCAARLLPRYRRLKDKMNKGKFIVLEGVEGAGKSKQCAMLVNALNESGIDTVLTREPGGAPLAESVRKLLLDPVYSPDAVTELYLYSICFTKLPFSVTKPSISYSLTSVTV